MNLSKEQEDAFRKRVRNLIKEEMEQRKREAIIRNLKSIFNMHDSDFQTVEDEHTFGIKIPYELKGATIQNIERAVRMMNSYKEYIKSDENLFNADDNMLTFNFVKNPVEEPVKEASITPNGELEGLDTEDRFDIGRREILSIIKRKYKVSSDSNIFPFEAAEDLKKNQFKYQVDRIMDKNSKDYGKRILNVSLD